MCAAEVAVKAGFHCAFNVFEGFEGDLEEKRRRGGHDLPFVIFSCGVTNPIGRLGATAGGAIS